MLTLIAFLAAGAMRAGQAGRQARRERKLS